MAPTPIPNELVDSIIDCLAHKKTALANCSVVCKSWTARSQFHLWKDIHISCNKDPEYLTRFIDCMRTLPVLGSRVKTLTLSWEEDVSCWRVDHQFEHELVSSVLERLTHLEAISCNITRLAVSPVSGLNLSSSVSELSLSRTRFDTMLDFHRFVTAFPSLRTLRIARGVYWDFDGETSLIQRHALKLEELALSVDIFPEQNPVSDWIGLLQSTDIEQLEFTPQTNEFYEVEETWKPVWEKLLSQLPRLFCDLRSCIGQNLGAGPLYAEDRIAIDLGHAESLRQLFLFDYVNYFPDLIRTVVNQILPSLAAGKELDSCTICLYNCDFDRDSYWDDSDTDEDADGALEGSDKVEEDHDGEEDSDVREPDYEEIEASWSVLANCRTPPLRPPEPRLRCRSGYISVRLLHPLEWNNDLCEVLNGLQPERFGITFRLEYIDADGDGYVFVQ